MPTIPAAGIVAAQTPDSERALLRLEERGRAVPLVDPCLRPGYTR
jgi:hypothetical protein